LKNDDSELEISLEPGSLITIGNTLDADDVVSFIESGGDTSKKLDELTSEAGRTTDDSSSDSSIGSRAVGRRIISFSRF
jgi:hypothetical protein